MDDYAKTEGLILRLKQLAVELGNLRQSNIQIQLDVNPKMKNASIKEFRLHEAYLFKNKDKE